MHMAPSLASALSLDVQILLLIVAYAIDMHMAHAVDESLASALYPVANELFVNVAYVVYMHMAAVVNVLMDAMLLLCRLGFGRPRLYVSDVVLYIGPSVSKHRSGVSMVF